MKKVIGFKSFNFTDRDTNKKVEGTTIFYTDQIDTNSGSGLSAEKFSLSPMKVAELPCRLHEIVGQTIEPIYNRYGKVENIILVPNK